MVTVIWSSDFKEEVLNVQKDVASQGTLHVADKINSQTFRKYLQTWRNELQNFQDPRQIISRIMKSYFHEWRCVSIQATLYKTIQNIYVSRMHVNRFSVIKFNFYDYKCHLFSLSSGAPSYLTKNQSVINPYYLRI